MIERKKEWLSLQDNIFLEVGDPVLSAVNGSEYTSMEGTVVGLHGDRMLTIENSILDNDMVDFGYTVRWSNGDVSTWSCYCFSYDKRQMRIDKIDRLVK